MNVSEVSSGNCPTSPDIMWSPNSVEIHLPRWVIVEKICTLFNIVEMISCDVEMRITNASKWIETLAVADLHSKQGQET